MSEFNLDKFVSAVKTASKEAGAYAKIQQMMLDTFAHPTQVAAAMPALAGTDEILYEDEHISIWHVFFDPNKVVPPHDHQIEVAIGIYSGTERNFIFKPTDNSLELEMVKDLEPGATFFLKPETIHAAGTATAEPVLGIHIYMGELTKVDRSLFDWDTGEALSFSDEVYENLKRDTSYLQRYL